MTLHRVNSAVFWGACVALILGTSGLTADEVRIVVPNGLEDTEGDLGSTIPPGTLASYRSQSLYSASQFASLPDSPPMLLTGLRLRPDRSQPGPATRTSANVEVRLSTTTNDSVTLDFARNHGDDETRVRSGSLTLSTANVGPPEGPKSFDYVVDFDMPFSYDPNLGNLLVDICNKSGGVVDNTSTLDWQTGTDVFVGVSGGANASTGTLLFQEILVREFVFAHEPLLGDLNLDGEVNGLDVDPFVAVLLGSQFDVAADMNGDGVVNGLDVQPFVAAVVGGGAAAVPEPSTVLLCLIALGVVDGLRRWGGCRRAVDA
jgi:hypothetical protein